MSPASPAERDCRPPSLPTLAARLRADSAPADAIGAAYDLIAARDPAVRAFVAITPKPLLLEEAAALQQLEATAAPLYGVPTGIKDIISVAGLPTRAGSPLPPGLFAGPEAGAVTRLRSAGALVVGKTATTEFAFSEPAATTNPHHPDHTPGGSSSGSAAAVAAGFVPLALGTQTVDSVVTPAAYCGVVGFKPTFGRVPVTGVVPFAPAMDHMGWFAIDVAGVALAATVLVDGWQGADAGRLPRIGIPADAYLDRASAEARAGFFATIEALAGAGCTVVGSNALDDVRALASSHRRLIARQFAVQHRTWFDCYGDRYRPRSADLYREGAALDDSVIPAGKSSSGAARGRLEGAMSQLGIDVWASPAATGTAPPGLDFIGDPIMALPWTHAHLPVVTIPAGRGRNGLPLGLQLAGGYGADESLLAFAVLIEELVGASRQPPRS